MNAIDYQSRKQRTRNWLACLFALSLLVGAGLACGQVTTVPYPDTFGSSGQCRAEDTSAKFAGEAALVTAINSGSNITICILRASDGILLKHYDLAVHGDIVGEANGLLYLSERGGNDGHIIGLCAISLRNGQQRWCQPQVSDDFFSTFQSNNGAVYVKALSGTGNLVFALNEVDGRLLWRYSTAPANAGADTLAPVLDNGVVYVSTSQNLHTGVYAPSTSISHICALQESLGRQLWCRELAEPRIDGMAADGQLFVRTATYGTNNSSATVYALDLATGSILWHISLGASQTVAYHPQLLVSNGSVYVNVRNCRCYASIDVTDLLFALSTSDGKQLWMTTIPQPVQTLTATRSALYIGIEGGDGVTALRTSDGSRIWNHPMPWEDTTSPALVKVQRIILSNQTLYALANYDNYASILALDMQDGNARWQDSACNAPPGLPTIPPFYNHSSPPGRCYWSPGEPASQLIVPLTM